MKLLKSILILCIVCFSKELLALEDASPNLAIISVVNPKISGWSRTWGDFFGVFLHLGRTLYVER
jgi:hypothetical protein